MITMILLMLLQTAMLAFSQVALKLAMQGLKWEWSWTFIWPVPLRFRPQRLFLYPGSRQAGAQEI